MVKCWRYRNKNSVLVFTRYLRKREVMPVVVGASTTNHGWAESDQRVYFRNDVERRRLCTTKNNSETGLKKAGYCSWLHFLSCTRKVAFVNFEDYPHRYRKNNQRKLFGKRLPQCSGAPATTSLNLETRSAMFAGLPAVRRYPYSAGFHPLCYFINTVALGTEYSYHAVECRRPEFWRGKK